MVNLNIVKFFKRITKYFINYILHMFLHYQNLMEYFLNQRIK